MRMKKTIVIILLIFGLNILGSNFLINSILIEFGDERIFDETLERTKLQNLTSTESISQAYISIIDNEDFREQATLNSWPGDGSAGNPFIIADQEIETSNRIYIENTDVNFEIRNLTMYGDVGEFPPIINLVNVENGRIYDNVIDENGTFGLSPWDGPPWLGSIKLENCNNNFIINNTVKGFVVDWRLNFVRHNSGIVLDNCSNTIISDNDASVLLYESRKNSILNNNVYELELENSGDNTIINNNILITTPGIVGEPRYLRIEGNALNHYRQFVVENNTFEEKVILYYHDLFNQPILENLTHEIAEVILVNCSSTSIRNKEIDVNSSETIPIRLNYCNDMIIDNCSRKEPFDENWGSTDLFIRESQKIIISNNDEMIIELQSVFNSSILNNNDISIHLQSNFSGNSIVNNSLYSLNYASSSSSITNNVIKNNTFYDNNNPGIRLTGENNIFKRNILDCPISIDSSQNVVCANNLTNMCLDEDSGINYIYTNNFMSDQGSYPTYDDGYENVFVYNYWSDWTGPDENNDGSVDKPYLIGGTANNQDYDPSSVPFDHSFIVHLLTRPKVLFPNGREVISFNDEISFLNPPIHISWVPAIDSHDHGVTHSVFYSPDAGISWILIAKNLVESEIEWDTRDLKSDNDYLIKVVATCTEGKNISDTSDEPFTIFNLSSTTKPNVTPSFSLVFIFDLLIIVVFIRRLRSRRLFFNKNE